MDKKMIWQVLGIEPTTDEETIKIAYRTELVKYNPEDDPEGFKRLREAFEEAVKYANEEKIKEENGGKVTASDKPDSMKTDIDRHLDKAAEIYSNLETRVNADIWKEWLSAPQCTELDMVDDMREAFLAYTMDHYHYPHEIWKLFDQTFCYSAEHSALSELFPVEYLNFIEFRAKNDDFFEYHRIASRSEFEEIFGELLTDVKFDAPSEPSLKENYEVEIDGYLREGTNFLNLIDNVNRLRYDKYARRKNEEIGEQEEQEIKEQLEQSMATLLGTIEYMSTFDICHPVEIAGRLRALEMTGRMDEACKYSKRIVLEEDPTEADFYMMSTAVFMLLSQMIDEGKTDEELFDRCVEVTDSILSERDTFLMALKCKSLVYMIQGKMKEASDTIIKVLDVNSRDNEAVKLLKDISEASINVYRNEMENQAYSNEEKMELAWAMFRREDADGVLEILNQIEPDEKTEYGYYSLYGRNYFNVDKFEEAYPYLLKWKELLGKLEERKNSGEKMSEKELERLDRKSFCYYMIAACSEELKKEEEAIEYYDLAVSTLKGHYRDMNELLFYQESYGKLLHKLGRYQDAMAVWNDMIEVVDHCVPGYIHRQETAYEMRDAQLVIDDYYNITRDVPNYPKAYVYAAKVFMVFNQKDDVDAVLKRAKDADAYCDQLRLLEARHLSKQNKLAEAEKLYLEIDEAVEKEESDIEDPEEFFADISSFYMNMRDENGERNALDKAYTYIIKGLEKLPDNKALLWRLTDVYEWKGKHGDTETLYKKMMSIFPDDANVNFEYGEYLRRSEQESKAKEQYYECLKKDEGHTIVNNRLMDIYQRRFLESEKPADYERAVKMATNQLNNADDDYYRIERALLYLDGYELDKALEDAMVAVEKAPDNVYAHNAVGLALMHMDKFVDAKAEFDKAIEVDNDNDTPNPYINASKCCEALGDYKTAAKYLLGCMEKFNTTANTRENLAAIYMKMKDVDNALKVLDDICEMFAKRFEETGNRWYNLRTVHMLCSAVHKSVVSDDESLINKRKKILESYLRDKGYNKKKKEVPEQDRSYYADIYEELGDYYKNLREFENAAECYSEALWLRMIRTTEVKSAVLGLGSKKVEVEKFPEEDEETIYKNLINFYSGYSFVLGMCGRKKESEEIAKHAMKCIINLFGSVEDYLSFKKYRPSRIQCVFSTLYALGDREKALEYCDQMDKCPRCEMCHYVMCGEKFLRLGRMYEMEGMKKEALDFYRMTWEKCPDDPETYIAIKELEKICNSERNEES